MASVSVFEEKSISKAIIRVGLPAMLGQLTTLIYNIADTFFVSMTNEPAMIAAVTLCAPVLLIIMSIACIFGMGGNSVIARLLGEERTKEAGSTFTFCTYAMAGAGILVLAFGLVFLNPLAHLVGADAANLGYTCDYLHYIFLGAPFIMLANGFVHLFRSAGLIKEGTVGLILGNGINILLDYVFIVMLGWGTAGAALATSLGFVCATVYYVFCMLRGERRGNELISLKLSHCKPTAVMVKKVVTIGVPGALITVLLSVSNIVLNNFIGIYGSNAVAAYGIANKINMVPIMLSVGLAQGIMPLIGYYYGAGLKKRMNDTVKYSACYGMAMGAFFTVSLVLLSRPLAAVFLQDAALIEQAGYFLRILCLSAPMLGVINTVTNYFQAVGKALPSLTITLMRNAVLFIPAVILLNHFWALNGVIAAQPLVETVLMVVSAVMYGREARRLKLATPPDSVRFSMAGEKG